MWEEMVALQGFAAALGLSLWAASGPASTRLIHDWVSARVKTHRLTPCKHTGGCVGVDETGYFVGLW